MGARGKGEMSEKGNGMEERKEENTIRMSKKIVQSTGTIRFSIKTMPSPSQKAGWKGHIV